MPTNPSLKRQLGLTSAIALVVGEVIAIGIFLTPAQMSKSLGSPALIGLTWVAMGALSLLGTFCYGELAARYPQAGGGYVYLREAFGPGTAFLYGWQCFLVMDPGLTAAQAAGFASYAAYVLPLTHLETKAIAVGCILLLAAANAIGVRMGAFVLRWVTALKVGVLVFIIGWALMFRLGEWSHFSPLVHQRPGSDPLGAAMAAGFLAAFFSLAGWWDLNKIGGEVRDPRRTLPRALTIGILTVTVLYLATSAVFLYLVPVERVESGETFAAQAGEALFGRMGGMFFSFIVMLSIFGSLAGIIMAAPRVYYAMSRDGAFPGWVASVHPRFGTPARAILIQSALASIVVALGTFSQIVAYFIFVTVGFIALTAAGAILLRVREGPCESYRMPGYPVTPVGFLAMLGAVLVLVASARPIQAAIGVAVVALGVPVYWVLQPGRPPRAQASEAVAPSQATIEELDLAED